MARNRNKPLPTTSEPRSFTTAEGVRVTEIPVNPKPSKSFTTAEGVNVTEIPLRSPDYGTKPTGKTLLDIIEERRPRDSRGTPIGASHNDDEEEVELFGLGMNTLFFVVPLTILLFWLDVLVHNQYRQEIDWSLIAGRCAKGFPAIFAIHYFVHPRRDWVSMRLFLLALSVAAGCYVVKAVNKYGYYYVMKNTPPLGTMWVWAVIEMDLVSSVLNLVGVGAYLWWYGYSIL